MHSILFVLEEPARKDSNNSTVAYDNWVKCHTTMQKDVATSNVEIKRLAQNLFLLPAKNGLPAFGELIRVAGRLGVPYKVLFFEKEPEWVSVVPPFPLGQSA